MKYTSFSLLAVLASVSAFVPAQQSARVSTEQAALADQIFGLDLFAPNPDVNTYGARKKKNVSSVICNLARGQIWLFIDATMIAN